jgi:hypothetical protein
MNNRFYYILVVIVIILLTGTAGAQWHIVKPGIDFQAIAFVDSVHGYANIRLIDTVGYWHLTNDCIYRTEDGGKTWSMVLYFRGNLRREFAYELWARDSMVLASISTCDEVGGMPWGLITCYMQL